MAIPTTALVWPESMDPYDVVDYSIDCKAILDEGENVAGYTITPYAEAALLGLSTGTGNYATSISGSIITVWLQIAANKQEDAAFDGNGASLPLSLSITTSSTPPRKKQRTLVVRVQQR
jgi:hypothetical protein